MFGTAILSLIQGAQQPTDLTLPAFQDTDSQQSEQNNFIAIALIIALLFGGIYALTKIK